MVSRVIFQETELYDGCLMNCWCPTLSQKSDQCAALTSRQSLKYLPQVSQLSYELQGKIH